MYEKIYKANNTTYKINKIKKINTDKYIVDWGRPVSSLERRRVSSTSSLSPTTYHPERRESLDRKPSETKPIESVVYHFQEEPKKSNEDLKNEHINKMLDNYYEVIKKSMNIDEIENIYKRIQELIESLSGYIIKNDQQKRLEEVFKNKADKIINDIGKVFDIYQIGTLFELVTKLINSFPNYLAGNVQSKLNKTINERIKRTIQKISIATSIEESENYYDTVIYLLKFVTEDEKKDYLQQLDNAINVEKLEEIALENISIKINQLRGLSNISEVKSIYNDSTKFMKYLSIEKRSELNNQLDNVINNKLNISILPLMEEVNGYINNVELSPVLNLADYDDIILSDYENMIYADFCKEFSDSNRDFSIPKEWKQFPNTYLNEILPYESQEIEHTNVENIIGIHQIWMSLLPIVSNIQDGDGKDKFYAIKRMMINFVIKLFNKNILSLNMSDRTILCQEAIGQCDALIEEFTSDIPNYLLKIYKFKKSRLYKKWNDLNIMPIIRNHNR